MEREIRGQAAPELEGGLLPLLGQFGVVDSAAITRPSHDRASHDQASHGQASHDQASHDQASGVPNNRMERL